MKKIIKSVKGTRDFYPDEMAKRQWLIQRLAEASEAFGYRMYDGPCLETIDLYAAKSGEELVKEQAFVFNDRGGDPITLRPELTPTVARMVASRQNMLTFPLRWWSFGPFWRYERPQKGRTREFFQWNIDQIGSDSIQADAELLAVAATFFKNVGLSAEIVRLYVNDRQLMDTELSKIGIKPEQKPAMLHLIDRLDKLPAEIWDEKALAEGFDTDQIMKVRALLEDGELWRNSEAMRQLFVALQALGVAEYVTYSPKIIRGLDYYTGTVFEAHAVNGEFRAILGGGHYANLVGEVGGDPLPGVGFAMGDVVIMLVLEAYGLLPPDVIDQNTLFMTAFNEETLADSNRLASRLRAEGFKVVQAEPEKLAKQFKYADRLGLSRALVLGPEEIATETVVVKDLRTYEQTRVTRAELTEYLRGRFQE